MDLLEGTKRGSFISVGALFLMLSLFLLETISFFGSSFLQTDVSLDLNRDPKLRVNLNITMMDMSCDYATVDVVSPLGTSLNVTTHLSKYALDAEGVRQRYKGRNFQQHDIILSDSLVQDSIEELHENGEDAVSLDAESLQRGEIHYFVWLSCLLLKGGGEGIARFLLIHHHYRWLFLTMESSVLPCGNNSEKGSNLSICRLLCILVFSLQRPCTDMGGISRNHDGSCHGTCR